MRAFKGRRGGVGDESNDDRPLLKGVPNILEMGQEVNV
jgi:hypothetical protein